MTIRWHKLFTRQNLGRFSGLASLAIFLSAGGFASLSDLSCAPLRAAASGETGCDKALTAR